MTLEELNKRIKSGNLSGIYFFYGDEQYLLSKKIDAIIKRAITNGTESFNLFKFDGKKVTAGEILAAIDQFPQMSDMKVIIVKSTGILNNATLTDFKLLKEAFVPKDTCLIFVEQSFDKKKLKNLEFIEKNGGIINFEYMPLNKLEIFVSDLFTKREKSISEKDIRYIISLCGQSLANITKECEKLISFAGDKIKITREDIDLTVSKTVEYRTYDMLDAIIAGNSQKAQAQLKYLKDTREEPLYILGLMMSRLSELLMCKLLKEDGLSANKISDYFDFKKPLFAVNKTIDESKRFGEKYLKRMIDKGLSYDFSAKQGLLAPWSAVEMYLAELIQ